MCASPLLIRLIAVQVLIHASMTGMRMAAPLLVLRQGHSAIAAGALISLFALAPVFLSVPAGRFADRNTLQRPVAISIICAVTSAALAAAFHKAGGRGGGGHGFKKRSEFRGPEKGVCARSTRTLCYELNSGISMPFQPSSMPSSAPSSAAWLAGALPSLRGGSGAR